VISGDITGNIPLREFYTLLQCISNPIKSGSGYGKLPARASLYYLKDDKAIDYIPDDESIAVFKERLQGMIAAVCAEEFVTRPSYMGCRGAITWICVRWGRRK